MLSNIWKSPNLYDNEYRYETIYVITNESDHMGGVGLPPEYLRKNGVEIMLCGGMGHKPLRMFESYGIQVFVGAKGTVREP